MESAAVLSAEQTERPPEAELDREIPAALERRTVPAEVASATKGAWQDTRAKIFYLKRKAPKKPSGICISPVFTSVVPCVL